MRTPLSSPSSSAVSVRWVEIALVFLIALAVLGSLIAFYDNAHRATTNGLWKSISVAQWVDGAPGRVTDGGNLLYYPAVGALVRALPSEAFGPVWQRMAAVNALLGAVVVALTYLIAIRLFASRAAASFVCLFQISSGFFLLLSTINEDIMPGYLWYVAAIACAVWPRAMSPFTIAVTAQCLALSWLFHSSLQLPGLAAFGLALLLADGDFRRGIARAVQFCAWLIPLPVLSAVVYGLPWWSGLWSGKGIGTGWGGFDANKVVFLWSGSAQAVLGGENLATLNEVLHSPRVWLISGTWLLLALLITVSACEARRRLNRIEWRLACVILGASFVFGEAMNLYVQPQDPQMQIQPMTWVPFAAGCFWVVLEARPSVLRIAARTTLVAAVLALFTVNVMVYAGERDADSVAIRNIRALENLAPPSRTMFLVHGFEGMTTWLTVSWGRGAIWPNDESPSPVRHRRQFNTIQVAAEATVFPLRPAGESAANQVRLVHRALDEGFDVIATDIWALSDEGWVAWFDTVSDPDKPLAIRAALNEHFAGELVGEIPRWGRFYRISKRVP